MPARLPGRKHETALTRDRRCGHLGGRHRLGARLHGARDGDDRRPGVLLRRAGAAQERPQHHDDERRRARSHQRAVGPCRLLDRVRARLALVGRPRLAGLPRCGRGSRPRVRGHDPVAGARDVPADVRDHYAGADLGGDRGADAVPRLRRVPAAVGDVHLRPARPLGVGRGRVATEAGGARLRGRHGGAHQRGVSALVAARMLGPRRDFKRTAIVPHNVPLVLLGAGLLWFGWFGFNAGSALAANGLAAAAFTNTNTAAATALVTWACLDLFRTGKVTAVGAATGLVVGLVGITPAAGYITAPASLAVGALSALVSYTAIQIRSTTRLDDSLDVFSCHGLAGVAGAMLTGVFATKLVNPAGGDGWLAGNFAQMGVQLVAVLAAAALAAVGTAIIMVIVNATLGAKAGVREQLSGLDLSEHGEEAYFGGEQGALAGAGVAIGEGVIVSRMEAEGVSGAAAVAG